MVNESKVSAIIPFHDNVSFIKGGTTFYSKSDLLQLGSSLDF